MLAATDSHLFIKIIYNTLIILIATCFILFSFSKIMRNSQTWKATVTPLASIIGSGFLVVTPLYLLILGKYALFAVTGVVCLAYLMGYVMRYNIYNIEPKLYNSTATAIFCKLENLSYLALGVAYLISIPFYIKLLALFLLRGLNVKDEIISSWIATLLLSIIGIVGFFRGFKRLEFLEEYAVDIKLAFIFSMLFALIIYNVNLLFMHQWQLTINTPRFDFDTLRKLLGTIIIVQGFETSRFLSLQYNSETRARTMRYAQIISGIIYIVFVGLSLVVFDVIHHVSETSIIDISEKLALVLPYLLMIAAIMSQFSAAIADTLSAGGIFSEASANRLKPKHNYLLIAAIAILLTWTTNIFQIIALASRAFAFYYSIQAFEATLAAYKNAKNLASHLRVLLFVIIFCVMLMITIFGISA